MTSKAKATSRNVPTVAEQLIARFIIEPDADQIARAFAQADALLTNPDRLGDPQEQEGRASSWIQEEAETYIGGDDATHRLLEPDSEYRHYGGTIQTAFQEPSFCLGFALAYRLFVDNGGAR